MTSEKTREPTATSIFCDDIRAEVGNKFSFMGIYQSVLFIPEPEVHLPKFCVAAFVRQPVNDIQALLIKVLLNDDVIATKEFQPPQGLETNVDPNENSFLVTAYLQIHGLKVSDDSRIKVRVTRGDKEIKGGALRIKLASLSEA